MTKPKEEFAGRWGKSPYCKVCYPFWRKQDDRQRKADPKYLSHARNRRRERYQAESAYRENRIDRSRQYRAEHPQRDRTYKGGWAPQAVYQAIKAGKLTKLPCQVCGALRVHAHHPHGYEGKAIYDVVWLCALHHKQAHRDE
jgi:hypothetical protein